MAISRAQMMKELLPGLNALFGLEYGSYENEHEGIYEMESSDRAFEEEVQLSGFGSAPVKSEGSSIAYDTAQEVFTADSAGVLIIVDGERAYELMPAGPITRGPAVALRQMLYRHAWPDG